MKPSKSGVILDASVLAAFLDRRDRHNQWAIQNWQDIALPMLSCEAAITEACFILRNVYGAKEIIVKMIGDEIVKLPFCLEQEAERVRELMTRYQSVPMSLADSCLVRMAEIYPESAVLTLDSDFTIYRKNRNEAIAVIMP